MNELNPKPPIQIDIDYEAEDSGSGSMPDTAELKNTEENNYLKMLQRLKAEFDNYRRRMEKEKAELSQYVESELLRKFLPILDDFERLLDANSEDSQLREGYRLIYENLNSLLSETGLRSFTEIGDEFDPHRHDAVAVAQTSPENDNKIMSILRKGYIFKNRVLRPAGVKVGLFNQEERTITTDVE